MKVGTPALDAVSCWGRHHGPAIFLNVQGKHAQALAGRRASLVHEICHLLLDRRSALPMAEVLGGRVDRRVEARARAFAAEFLLPRHIAGAEMSGAGRNPRGTMISLMRRFGVSNDVVLRQAQNSGTALPDAVWEFVRSSLAVTLPTT